MSADQENITSTQQENRLFPPPAEFAAKALIKSRAEYDRMYRESIDKPEQFWGKQAEELHWFKKWDKVLEWNAPNAKWFVGGKTNVAYNCLDRQIEPGPRRQDGDSLGRRAEPAARQGGGDPQDHLQAACATKSANSPTA